MRVRVHAADEGGCGWYRLRYPAQVAAANGVDVELRDAIPGLVAEDHSTGRLHVHAIHESYDADVAVFQRPLKREVLETMAALQKAGVAVVVDMDDDFHALPKGHGARRDTAGLANPDANRLWLRRACEGADLVTVSTPALAERYGAHGRVRVLPNCVPEAMLTVEGKGWADGFLRVGWTGSTETHVGDLDVTGGGVGEAMAGCADRARFHVVGTGRGVREGLGLEAEPSATGWVAFDRYPREYARLDIALVPLAPNRFNDAKSWLKGLEAAALGVPFIASPVADYRRLNREGAGWLVEEPTAWRRAVECMVTDGDLRAAQAAQGRSVAARWTYEKRWGGWAEAWADAVENRQRARKGQEVEAA